MGLVIERHPSDVIIKAKMTVSVDKKGKYKLGAGEKVDIPLTEGKHTISAALNLVKTSVEIDYPNDAYLLVAFQPTTGRPGIYVQNLTSFSLDNNGKFCVPSCMNGMCGTLWVFDSDIKFQGIDIQSLDLKFEDIREISTTMGNLSIQTYGGEKYTFVLPQEKHREIIDFLKDRVDTSNQKMQTGFDLSFGIDGKIEVNEEKQEFRIRSGAWVSANYKLNQILSYESSEASKKADYLGGALAGNLLGGTGGAVLGALHAAGQSGKVEYIRMNLTVKTDKGIKALWVNLGDPVFAVERNSGKYALYTAECSKFIAYMDAWKKANEVQPNSGNDIDVATELRKYKAMLDDGIIDEADFKAKKKQLLGI